MKILLPLGLALLLAQAAPGQSPSTSPARGGKPEQMIRTLEERRFEAMVKKDSATMRQILADDLIYTHSNAKVDGKEALIASIVTGSTNYKSFQTEDVQVRDYGGTAVVTGLARVNVFSGGQDQNLRLRFTDVYVNRNGRWQMVAWQSTRQPEASPAPAAK
ncbi:MAG: nuclear transport factor 2 family protein [Ferruginibacter sp.]|nr:nuclear transport factor 2 family protein [Cytophagales bacterium]